MILILTLLILLILLFIHLILIPYTKKRPIFIKGFEGSIFIIIFLSFIAAIINLLVFILALAFGIFIYYTKCWIVYGVSSENIYTALDKAIIACRASSVKIENTCQIDNCMTVKVKSLGFKIYYIRYKCKIYSKKSELTKEIFRKFIQNYYI